MNNKPLTYRQLLYKLETLSDEQLNKPAVAYDVHDDETHLIWRFDFVKDDDEYQMDVG
jgi:hypothetical protein